MQLPAEPEPLLVHEGEVDGSVWDVLERRIGIGIGRDYTKKELKR